MAATNVVPDPANGSSTAGSSTLVRNLPYGSGLAGGVRNARWYKRVRENIIEYEKWCYEWAQEVYRVCKPGAFVAVFNSTRTVAHVQVALEQTGFYARDIIVYRRASGIPKGLNLSSHLQRKGRADYEIDIASCVRGCLPGIQNDCRPSFSISAIFLRRNAGRKSRKSGRTCVR